MSWGVQALVFGLIASVWVFGLLYVLPLRLSLMEMVVGASGAGIGVTMIVNYFNPKSFYRRMIKTLTMLGLTTLFVPGFYLSWTYSQSDGFAAKGDLGSHPTTTGIFILAMAGALIVFALIERRQT